MEIEFFDHSDVSFFLFPFSSLLLAVHRLVQNVSQQAKRSAIFTRFRWELFKHIYIESSRRLTVCTATSQSQKSPDSGLCHLIGAVSQRLVAFCQRSLLFPAFFTLLSLRPLIQGTPGTKFFDKISTLGTKFEGKFVAFK